MAPLVGIVVGVAMLLFGRRLYWVFVAGIGFLTGLEFAPEILPGQPDWVILVAALVAALVGALLAVMAQAFVIGAIGFVAGGGVALRFIARWGSRPTRPRGSSSSSAASWASSSCSGSSTGRSLCSRRWPGRASSWPAWRRVSRTARPSSS